jgi:hypothetical protein
MPTTASRIRQDLSNTTARPSYHLDNDFQVIGTALSILQLNVEGLSFAKRQLIQTIADQHGVDVLQGGSKNTAAVNLLYHGNGSEFSYQIRSIDSQLNYTQSCQIALICHFNPQSYVILNFKVQFSKLIDI